MNNKAVVSVIGKDRIGIIARVSHILAESSVNILDISQTIMQEFFTMIMIVDLENADKSLSSLKEELNHAGEEMGIQIRIQHQDTFEKMHRL